MGYRFEKGRKRISSIFLILVLVASFSLVTAKPEAAEQPSEVWVETEMVPAVNAGVNPEKLCRQSQE